MRNLILVGLFVSSLIPFSARAASWSNNSNNSKNQRPSYSSIQKSSSSASSYRSSDLSDDRSSISPFVPGSHNLSLDLGQVFLMGDNGDLYGNSIGGQIHYTYGVSNLFGFDASLGYSGHGDDYSMLSGRAGMRMNLSWFDKVIPYANFGLGFYRPSIRVPLRGSAGNITGSTHLNPMVFGIHVGPGVDLELTQRMFFGAALTFHDLFGQSTTLPDGRPYEIDGSFTTFFLRVGMTF